MKTENQELLIPNVKVLGALRNSGYNNYTAIADIIDNSLEKEVDSQNISVDFSFKSGNEFIRICDDGCGMNLETLKDAITLGSQSQKDFAKDLGAYGTGLKSSALSIGKRLCVKTKSQNDEFYIAIFDLDLLYEQNSWKVPVFQGSKEEYEDFKKLTNSPTGTIIEISKLDRVVSNKTQFRETLIKKLGFIFRYFVEDGEKNIFVDGKKLQGLDPMRRNKHYSTRLSGNLNESFVFNNKKYVFNAYYLDKRFKNEIDEDGHDVRSSAYCGLYIYRNLRLVGEHLLLGIIPSGGSGWYDGFRVELFIDGTDDYIFSSSFNKIIMEKDKNEVEQGFRDACKQAFMPYWVEARRRDKEYGESKNTITDETKKEFEDIVKGINANKTLNIPKIGGKNEKKDEDKLPPAHPRGPQQNPNPHKKRNDIWLKTEFEKKGEYGKIFDIKIEDGIHYVKINIDHVFWTEFLCKASAETKKMFINWFSSSSVALSRLLITPDAENMDLSVLLDIYHESISKDMNKLIKF